MGYFSKNPSDIPSPSRHPEMGKSADEWFSEFILNHENAGAVALVHLIESQAETHLLAALHSPRSPVMESAAYGLMECWISECGTVARDDLQRGLSAMEEDDLEGAELVFVSLIRSHGDWAEPIHQLGTLRYMQGLTRESMRLQRSAIRLKPHHFGAWHGLALNAVDMADWTLARDAAQRALAIRPNCPASASIFKSAIKQLS